MTNAQQFTEDLYVLWCAGDRLDIPTVLAWAKKRGASWERGVRWPGSTLVNGILTFPDDSHVTIENNYIIEPVKD